MNLGEILLNFDILGVVLLELLPSLLGVDLMRHRYEVDLSTVVINKIRSHALIVSSLWTLISASARTCDTRKMTMDVAELGLLYAC